jgi:mRNA-degrading endonuclease RelE of RelBE toxin-antitoxin system
MRIARTARFKKAWEQLSEEEKKLAKKAVRNLAVDMGYPGLRVKRIKGTDGIWEARGSRSLRLTFEVHGDTIVLRNIGRHDEALGRP